MTTDNSAQARYTDLIADYALAKQELDAAIDNGFRSNDAEYAVPNRRVFELEDRLEDAKREASAGEYNSAVSQFIEGAWIMIDQTDFPTLMGLPVMVDGEAIGPDRVETVYLERRADKDGKSEIRTAVFNVGIASEKKPRKARNGPNRDLQGTFREHATEADKAKFKDAIDAQKNNSEFVDANTGARRTFKKRSEAENYIRRQVYERVHPTE
jgi:hypothetical protein